MLVKTVKDVRSLELTFPFPDQDELYASKPAHFLSHYLGHEGEGSILSLLKAQGLANSLSAGCGGGGTGFDLFKVNVDLTKEGLDRYVEVAQTIFHYIGLLKSTAPQEWAFREVAMLSEISFRFLEKGRPASYVTALSGYMTRPYPRDRILSAPYTMTDFDRDQIAGALSMLDVDNCLVSVASQTPLPGFEYKEKEQWYGTQYTLAPLPNELIDVRSSKFVRR